MAKQDDIVDDVYPNDSESMGIYLDDNQADDPQTAELHQMASSYPIMDELIGWFDDLCTHYNSVDSIAIDDKMDDAHISRQLMVNKQLSNVMASKRNELAAKFAAYKQSMNPKPGDDNE